MTSEPTTEAALDVDQALALIEEEVGVQNYFVSWHNIRDILERVHADGIAEGHEDVWQDSQAFGIGR